MIHIEIPSADQTIFLTDYAKSKKSPGFYFMKSKHGDILYIGESNDIRHRLKEHFKGDSGSTRDFKHLFVFVEIHYCEAKDRKIYEIYAINKFDPPGNVWDNSNLTKSELQIRRQEWIQEEEIKLREAMKTPINRAPIKLPSGKYL